MRDGRRERLRLVDARSRMPFEHGVFDLFEEAWEATALERARAVAAGSEKWLLDA